MVMTASFVWPEQSENVRTSPDPLQLSINSAGGGISLFHYVPLLHIGHADAVEQVELFHERIGAEAAFQKVTVA